MLIGFSSRWQIFKCSSFSFKDNSILHVAVASKGNLCVSLIVFRFPTRSMVISTLCIIFTHWTNQMNHLKPRNVNRITSCVLYDWNISNYTRIVEFYFQYRLLKYFIYVCQKGLVFVLKDTPFQILSSWEFSIQIQWNNLENVWFSNVNNQSFISWMWLHT